MVGLGTVINVVTVLVGSAIGVAFGARLPERTSRTVTDALGLVTLVIGGLNVVALTDPAFVAATGGGAPLLIVLGALLVGGIGGSLLGIERRLEGVGGWLQARFQRGTAGRSGETSETGEAGIGARERFIEGFIDASLLFCVGPLAILGSLSDGLGRGIEQLALKSVMDGFASMAFAATLGWGVAASVVSLVVYQGGLTAIAALAGSLLPDALIASITATGGVLLLGVGFRLLQVRQVPVADLLPALAVAPVLTALVGALVA